MSNIPELETVIRKHFPEDAEPLIKVVRCFGGIEGGEFISFSPLMRKYSAETQEVFFKNYLEYLLSGCVKERGDSVNDLPRPNIEGVAKMMVDIVGIPVRTQLLSEDDLRDLAAVSLKACDCLPKEPFRVRMIDNVDDINASLDIGLDTGWKPYKDPSTQEYVRHPLRARWRVAAEMGEEKGLTNFTHTLQDESSSLLPVVDNISMELRDIWKASVDRGYCNYNSIAAKWASCTCRALVWEAMGKFVEKKEDRPCENPLRFYVDMTSPKFVPIGWDGKEFLVVKLQV